MKRTLKIKLDDSTLEKLKTLSKTNKVHINKVIKDAINSLWEIGFMNTMLNFLFLKMLNDKRKEEENGNQGKQKEIWDFNG